jgi:SAM-dependent methyltransferase
VAHRSDAVALRAQPYWVDCAFLRFRATATIVDTVTNAAGRPLAHPIGNVDLASLSASSVRAKTAASGLRGTPQGQALATAPDERILRHLSEDRGLIPAPQDREGYQGDDDLQYWIMGLSDAIYIDSLIRVRLTPTGPITILDFGCSSGRVLRHLVIDRQSDQLLGCDINPKSLQFIRSYLPSSIIAFHNVVYPPLPLADATVDFIYGLSVFTHIADFEEAWLLELKRILKPGGAAFLTVHTERTWKALTSATPLVRKALKRRHSATGSDYHIPLIDASFFEQESFGERCVITRLDYPVNNTNVFHSTPYIRERWGRFFSIGEIVEKAHGPLQDGIIIIA